MDQNQTLDNDLQTAIDNITNATSVDPVFSDPVAAPSSIPEGDTGELGEPIGPFPDTNAAEIVPPAPEPVVPAEPLNMAESPMPEPTIPEPTPTEPTLPEPTDLPPLPTEPTEPPVVPQDEPPISAGTSGLNMQQVKEAALRDLVPLLDKLTLDPLQKFNIYRDIFENLRDYSILEPAYKAAKEIPDETKRAESLLYLVEFIDKM